ncbi:unnamed protein product, partial [Symbiodinium necroappetens]
MSSAVAKAVLLLWAMASSETCPKPGHFQACQTDVELGQGVASKLPPRPAASCSAHGLCAEAGLTSGDCCPTAGDGIYLKCCDAQAGSRRLSPLHMGKKGVTIDDTTLQWCAGRIPQIWPNLQDTPVGSLRIFQTWSTQWHSEGRRAAWTDLVDYAPLGSIKILVGTPVTCIEADDDTAWSWTKELVSMLGTEHVMGLAVGNELELLYQNADSECIQQLWSGGRLWKTFQSRVTEFDNMGFSSVPVTSVFTASVLTGSAVVPFTEKPSEALVNTFLRNAVRKYGKRYAFTFNVYPYFDPNIHLNPGTVDKCNLDLPRVICWDKPTCLGPNIMASARKQMHYLTNRWDDLFWIGEIGWSSPKSSNLGTKMADCPQFSSLNTFQTFYNGFLEWDLTLPGGVPAPDHIFYFTLRDSLNFGKQEHFGLLTSCYSLGCKIATPSFRPQSCALPELKKPPSWQVWGFAILGVLLAFCVGITCLYVRSPTVKRFIHGDPKESSRRRLQAPPIAAEESDGATPLQSETRVDFWAICCPAKRAAGDSVTGLVAFAIVAWSSIQAFAEEHKVVSLSEETFAKTIQRGQRALVAFVTPWCLACRLLMAELEKLHEALQPQVLVAQCDVSKETGLANLYSAWRTPLVVLFPDTEVLLPGLQVIYAGQMHYSSLLSFANAGPWPPQLRSPLDLEEVVRESGRAGTFVGFFRSPEAAGHLQDLWPLDCLRRHNRAFTFARWANETDRNQSRGEEELWRWAGLGARKALRIKEVQEGQLLKQEIELDSNTGSADLSPVEAVVYVRADEDACQFAPSDKYVMYQEGGSSSSSARISPSSWRERVDAFCAWCERQVLGPVAVFDAPRAAALDGTFDWLLLLFAPKDVTEDQEGEAQGPSVTCGGMRNAHGFFALAKIGDALTASKGLHLSSQKRTQVKENDRLLQVPSSPVVELRTRAAFFVADIMKSRPSSMISELRSSVNVHRETLLSDSHLQNSLSLHVGKKPPQHNSGTGCPGQLWAGFLVCECGKLMLHCQHRAHGYPAAISDCRRGAQWQQVLHLLQEAENISAKLTVFSYSAAMSVCERAGQWRKGLQILQQMKAATTQADVVVYNAAISTCGHAGQWERSTALFKELQDEALQCNVISCNSVISACERAGNWTAALGCFEDLILSRRLQADAISYNSMITALAAAGRWQHAMQMLDDLQRGRIRATVVTCSAAMAACEVASCWEEALQLFGFLLKESVQANQISYNSAISVCETCGAWHHALLLATQMGSCAVGRDQITYNSALSAAPWHQAASLLSEAAGRCLRASVITLNSSIDVCGAAAQWQQALRLLDSPAGQAFDVITFNSTVSAMSSVSWESSCLLMAAMQRQVHKSDIVGYTAAISSCEEVSLWYQAAFLLADMAKQQTRVDSLSVSLVVGAFEKNASWQQTLSFLHDQRTQLVAVNILTYNLVMATCLDASEWQRVLALFRTLGGETVRANAITYSFCVEACDNGGHLKGQDSPVFARDLHSAGFEALRELRKKRTFWLFGPLLASGHRILLFRYHGREKALVGALPTSQLQYCG